MEHLPHHKPTTGRFVNFTFKNDQCLLSRRMELTVCDVCVTTGEVPTIWLHLAANVITQYICISGVFLLTGSLTPLSTTLVISIRKFIVRTPSPHKKIRVFCFSFFRLCFLFGLSALVLMLLLWCVCCVVDRVWWLVCFTLTTRSLPTTGSPRRRSLAALCCTQ